ncbi:baseplate multidomain protein megatron [Sinisalibacter aestuarii]|uniref:Phage host specificity protein n=1 Tax=Sinisalibacter aestuarii TaxID=2949426 RepID=A0ABQ5LVC7_9RHOB|nr:glycoside hydrolase TIM-barrel-like domain-containing protein [Sinisalibacter aestuarii]GKY88738.1 phage host specificity protein [Sinisalibacter aestuarii]
MATIVLSAVGASIGASVGGGFLGLSSVVIGRAAGAIAGSMIDQAVMGGGSETVEQGKVDRFRLTGVSEGAPIARVYGRMRMGGQVIWSSGVKEHATVSEESDGGSGKGVLTGAAQGTSRTTTVEYRYTMSLAIALCEGEITRVGRVWADGDEIAPERLNMRVYPGSESQMPDPKIEAVKGAGNVPAYRGVAYVVIEDLDITAFGNRVPVLNFEVIRPEQPDEVAEIARGTKAVAIIPGTGEYALATRRIHAGTKPGEKRPLNENTPLGKTDFAASLEMLDEALPGLEAASLVVSWFGDDLRCHRCEIRPLVERHEDDGHEMPWRVSGLGRAGAGLVPRDGGRPVYGGTPTDRSVVQAIRALKQTGKAVTFYPFILMTQMAGNGLLNPWTGDSGQPVLPWRGRITTSRAPGVAGSPDQTGAAAAEVAAFFGTATRGDFAVSGNDVSYSGPDEWSYRRFILHYAHLCQAAGGVDAFLIGSELRGLTQIRSARDVFPAVAALRALAGEVRAVLGPGVKISYAADWSEYFGFHPGNGDLFFHLDPLWADDEIDFIGIDNYMPLSDWRDGADHADAHWGSIYDLDYLKANILGGEGYDWYYHAPEAEALQLRTPITDGAHDEPWVWRYKDLPGWWRNAHHQRVDGARAAQPTDWVPGSKPIWFTEIGCAAIDKGTNQPNKFLDPKSSESTLPKYSDGTRDDFIQMRYLRALNEFWADPANNPVDAESGVRMLDMSRAHVWAWDARPFPWFPARRGLWSDGDNYRRGHWLNGREANRSLASVASEICTRSGVAAHDVSRLYGVVRGYAVNEVTGGRNALQPLMLAHGFEAAERDGVLTFFSRTGLADGGLDQARLALNEELEGHMEVSRAPEAETAGRVRLNFIEADAGYETRAVEAIFPDEATHAVSQSELAMVLTGAEGRAITERWLAEARVARDGARFALPPSGLGWRAGDVVRLDLPGGAGNFRIDHLEQGMGALARAVRVEPGVFRPAEALELAVEMPDYTPPVPVLPLFLDLPLLSGEEVPHAPHLAVTALPWPGPVAVYRGQGEAGYKLIHLAGVAARIGVSETALPRARAGVIDRGPALRVRMSSGDLSSAALSRVLSGANAAAIGDGSPGNWEVFQFTTAELVDEDLWEITGRLRGQAGTDALMPEVWPAGSYLVMLDGAVAQIPHPAGLRGLERDFRIGPAARSYDDETYIHAAHAFEGVGLRPLAPVHLTARWAGGDLAVSWIRRTRIDGDGWLSAEVPLGEEAERYTLRVMVGQSVLREAEVTAPAWTYSAAMRAADGVSGPFAIEVAQVSARVGSGPFRRIAVAG